MMANYLKNTECAFYSKIGACRHGDKCKRIHIKPKISQTLKLSNFYLAPISISNTMKEFEYYCNFYKDILNEIIKFGEVEQLLICENRGDHMVFVFMFLY